MSRASGEDGEPELDGRTSLDDTEFAEDQPLRVLSRDASEDDVEVFAESHNLTDELPVFLKAASLLRAGGLESAVENLVPAERRAVQRQTSHKWHQPRTLYFTVFVCALGAIEQGMGQTGMNGANLYLPEALNIDSGSASDSFILGLINCGIYLANSLCGSWLAQPLNERLGRRGAIFTGTVLCLCGNLLSSVSWSWPVLLSSRFVLGVGLGLNASTVAVFAGESAPAYIRGGLAVSWQMCTAFGICLGFMANVAFYDYVPDVIWRLQLAAPIVPTMPLLMLLYLCPESSAWHVKRGRYDLAFSSLVQLRNTKLQAACELYADNLRSRKTSKELPDVPSTFAAKLASLFKKPRNRHALYASYTVMISQQLCGINIIAFYSTTIFSSSGFSALAALWASVVFGVVNFIGAGPAVWTMDTFGRRRLLLWTLPFMAITMGLTSVALHLPVGTLRLTLLASLVYLFCALYSPGVGPVPVAYSAEVYPASVREVGMSFAISTANMWAAFLSITFPLLLRALGEQGSFALYAFLNVVAWILCWTFVRETKGIELTNMDAVFESSPAAFVAGKWAEGLAKYVHGRQQK